MISMLAKLPPLSSSGGEDKGSKRHSVCDILKSEIEMFWLRCTCSLGAGEQRRSTSTGQVEYAVQSLKPAVMSVEVAVAIIVSGTTKEAS